MNFLQNPTLSTKLRNYLKEGQTLLLISFLTLSTPTMILLPVRDPNQEGKNVCLSFVILLDDIENSIIG